MTRHAAALLALTLVPFTAAHADLVEVDTPLGVGSATLDTDTGLEWLDVTVTANLSYTDMIPLLMPGGTFHGWRYATVNEVDDLFFLSAGLLGGATVADRGAAMLDFIGLLGNNGGAGAPGTGFFRRASRAMYDVPGGVGRLLGEVVVDVDASGTVTNASASPSAGSVADTFAGSSGHWLVRQGSICGDGVVEGAELCDNGPGSVCDADDDADGWCDTFDLCDGDDASGDADADGVCNDLDFTLHTTAPVPGASMTFVARNAAPSSTVEFWATMSGFGALPCVAGTNFCGFLSAPVRVATVTANASGRARTTLTVPNLPSGRLLLLQALWRVPGSTSGDLSQVEIRQTP